MRFTWDARKASANARKHGVTFEEAATVFADPLASIVDDTAHDDRALILGDSIMQRLLVVVFSEIDEREIRIISARRATKRERRSYEETQGS